MASQIRSVITLNAKGEKEVGSLEAQLEVAAEEITALQVVVSGLGSSLPSLTAFSTTLTLNANKYATQQTVGGALAFTASGTPVAGSKYFVRLVANGVNVPTFASNFKELEGSAGFDNRNGVINLLQVFYDGAEYLYTWAQRRGDLGADNVGPILNTATVGATGTTLTLVFNESLDQTKVLSAADFTLSGSKSDSSPVYVNATTVSMTVTAFTAGEVITLNVAAGAVRDLAGNNIAAIAGISIANNSTGASSLAVRFTTKTNATESGAAPWTYTYASQQSSDLLNTSALSIPASTDGGFEFEVSGATAAGFPILSISTTNTATGFNQNLGAVGLSGGSVSLLSGAQASITPNVSGGLQTPNLNVGTKFRLFRVGNDLFASMSVGGAAFTTFHNFGAIGGTAVLYPFYLSFANNASPLNMKVSKI